MPFFVSPAARMLEALDPEVDRCQDFYNYACGTWNRIHEIPSDRPSYNTFHKMSDDLQTKLRGQSQPFAVDAAWSATERKFLTN